MNPALANTVNGSVAEAVCGGDEESIALTWTLKFPELVLTPLIAPLLLKLSPAGNPETRFQLIGGVPPAEDTVLL